MAIADMFLKVQGATGEASDTEHKGEIDVMSWSWGMQAPTSITGQATGKVAMSELVIVKRADQSSPTLMGFLRNHKDITKAVLTVRKAGSTPLEYFKIELENARITSLKTGSENAELTEHWSFGFDKIRVSYTPQSSSGGAGGGANVFETEATAAR